MTTSRSFRELLARIEKREKEMFLNLEKLMRRVGIRMDQVVVVATPFKTGRARNNWLVLLRKLSLNNDFTDTQPLKGLDPSGSKAMARAEAKIARYNLGQTIYLVNNVPYIIPLEKGSSKQAPKGMAKQAVRAGLLLVKKAKLFRAGR